jgi:hypothetical protein
VSIVGVRPALNGVYVALRCPACGATHAAYQPTVAGLAIADHPCDCGTWFSVSPDGLVEAAGRMLPQRTVADAVALTEEASRIVEEWHRAGPFRDRLRHLDVDLAAPTERETTHLVLLGLLAALEDRRVK